MDGAPVQVTASIGAALARTGERLADLLTRADSAMYAAKQDGKDRVAFAD